VAVSCEYGNTDGDTTESMITYYDVGKLIRM